jgi:hypothetical protein
MPDNGWGMAFHPDGISGIRPRLRERMKQATRLPGKDVVCKDLAAI